MLCRQALRLRSAGGEPADGGDAVAGDRAAPAAAGRIERGGVCDRILADAATSDRLNLRPQADMDAMRESSRAAFVPDARLRIVATWRFIA